MAMDVVSVVYFTDCTTRGARIHFALDIPVPPTQAEQVKAAMDKGDWTTFKAQVKQFAPLSLSAATDFLMTVAPQKPAPPPKPKS